MTPFDIRNPITSESSLMLDHVAWGWELPPEAVVSEQVAPAKEPVPVDSAKRNEQEPELKHVGQQLRLVEETAAKTLPIQSNEVPPEIQDAVRRLQQDVVHDQVTEVPELVPVGFDMQNGQDPEVQDVDQQIVGVEETEATKLVILNDKEPREPQEAGRSLPNANHESPKKGRGRPKGSKNRVQTPQQQQLPAKRTRRSVNPDFALPPGWKIEESIREKGRFAGKIDKTYIEPGTGHRYRSKPEVQAHLESLEKNLVQGQPSFAP